MHYKVGPFPCILKYPEEPLFPRNLSIKFEPLIGSVPLERVEGAFDELFRGKVIASAKDPSRRVLEVLDAQGLMQVVFFEDLQESLALTLYNLISKTIIDLKWLELSIDDKIFLTHKG